MFHMYDDNIFRQSWDRWYHNQQKK